MHLGMQRTNQDKNVVTDTIFLLIITSFLLHIGVPDREGVFGEADKLGYRNLEFLDSFPLKLICNFEYITSVNENASTRYL